MNNTLLITSREYLTRVKKKSFIILTLLVPLLLAALMVVPAFKSQNISDGIGVPVPAAPASFSAKLKAEDAPKEE